MRTVFQKVVDYQIKSNKCDRILDFLFLLFVCCAFVSLAFI